VAALVLLLQNVSASLGLVSLGGIMHSIIAIAQAKLRPKLTASEQCCAANDSNSHFLGPQPVNNKQDHFRIMTSSYFLMCAIHDAGL
jgi:hypothetical protein